MEIKKVGIVGCGLMGSGVAEVCAKTGYKTIVREISEEALKKGESRILKSLDGLCPPHTIFASNTSSLSIVEMGSVTKRISKILGMHFFNPVPVMKLVELVKPITISEEVFETAKKFALSLGKTAIIAKDTPGFIVNLLLIPYLLDAVRAVESGVATKEDIDTGMSMGWGAPMGPITLLDFVGLDTTYFIAEAMYQEFKDTRYAAPPLLNTMVLAG